MKKILILISLLIIAFITIFVVSNKVEKTYCIEKSKQIERLIKNKINMLYKTTVDWSEWDETAKFMITHSNNYIKSNLDKSTLKNLGIDFIIFIGIDKNPVYAFFVDTGSNLTTGQKVLLLKIKTKFYNILSTQKKFFKIKTLTKFDNKIYILTFHPITKNSGSPPGFGTLIFGKKIDKSFFKKFYNIIFKKIYLINFCDNEIKKIHLKNGYSVIPLFDYQGNKICCIKAKLIIPQIFNTLKWLLIIIFFILILISYLFLKVYLSSREKKLKDQIYIILSAIEQSKTGVLITKFDGTIIYINEFVCKKTGYTKEELIGENYSILLSFNSLREIFFKELMQNKGYWQGEIKGKTKDNKFMDLEVVITPIFEERNKTKVKCFITTCEFISDRKKLIKELKKAKEEVENFIKIKNQFLMNLSHELKTPLTGITGFIDLLSLTDLNDEQKNYVEYLKNSAYNLTEILSNLIAISKLEFYLNIEKYPFSFIDFNKKIIKKVKHKIYEKSLELKYNFDKNIPEKIIGNKDILFKILNNVFDNAIKFTERGKIEYLCRLLEKSHDGSSVKICFIIKDTGIGMDKNEIRQIFEPFTQMDYSTTRKYEGLGIGLTIARKYIEALSGQIIITSEKGKGTEIKIFLEFDVA